MNRRGGRLGNTGAQPASPLPQSYASSNVGASRIVNGFSAYLPGRTRLFFQRQFFANYPRPIQVGAQAPFPRRVNIARILAPERQVVVIRAVRFTAYAHSGIGVEDLMEVPRGRTVATLGFEFQVGNRGLTDFSTNLPGRGVPVIYNAVDAASGGNAPRAGQGIIQQGSGLVTPPTDGENFASYAQSKMPIVASAVVFRPPSFDLRVFEVQISGWLSDEYEMGQIIDKLSR